MKEIEASQIIREIEMRSSPVIEYTNSVINGDLVLSNGRSINLKLVFNNCTFNGKVYLDIIENWCDLIFDGSKFLDHTIVKISHRGQFSFNYCIINKGLELYSVNEAKLELNNICANGFIDIKCPIITTLSCNELIFEDFTKDSSFTLKSSRIKNEASFKGSKLANAVFNDTVFDDLVSFDRVDFLYYTAPGMGNFFNVVFHKNAYFNSVNFDKGAFFNGATFNGSAIFLSANTSFNCIGNFSGVTFQKRVFFDQAKFKKATFKNCEFVDIASFKDFKAIDLNISRALFLKGADFLNAEIVNADRETFRIIKNEFLKINNQVEALHYRAKEMIAYEKELKLRHAPGELFLLYLNKLSNNHGLSWLRGLLFTFLIAMVFYLLYLLSLEKLPFVWGWVSWDSYFSAVGSIIKFFIRFLIVTHDLDFMTLYKPTAVSFLIDFVAKVFIGYGVYQTIQAFRKYGKG